MNKKVAVPRSQAVGPNSTQTNTRHEQEMDVLLTGGSIMSVALGTWLQELEPGWSITVVEQMSSVAEENLDGWNNAGTGHAVLMELNYTPQIVNSIDIDKAVDVNEAFHISRQFWAHQVMRGILNKPKSFINSTPHVSFVWNGDNVSFLCTRYAALQQSELFRGIRYPEDHQQIKAWAPLVVKGRDPQQKMVAIRIEVGTDVNYGEITRQLIAGLQKHDNFSLQLGTVVRCLKCDADRSWMVTLADVDNRCQRRAIRARFISIGAGGAALTPLQEINIPQVREYAGFPVDGQFLVCENPEVVNRYLAKVYGQTEVDTPPMPIPYIDTRAIDGKRMVLFGLLATFSTRFLRNGSLQDLLTSTDTSNILPMLSVGLDSFGLVRYLINRVMQRDKDHLTALCEYYPEARKENWRLWQAGRCVQIIKCDTKRDGVLRLGTEVAGDDEGTVATPLGASPGASTVTPIMLQLMEKVFKDKVNSLEWQTRLKAIIPTYGIRLNSNPAEIKKALAWINEVLELKYEPAAVVDQAPQAELKPLSGGKPMADITL